MSYTFIFKTIKEQYTEKSIVHTYGNKLDPNEQLLMGFGDFLRGTVTLYLYCKDKYNIKINISNNPIRFYINDESEYLINNDYDKLYNFDGRFTGNTSNNHEQILTKIDELFINNTTINIITNICWEHYYNINTKLPNDSMLFMQNLFKPNYNLQKEINSFIKETTCNKPFNILQIRTGDQILVSGNTETYETIFNEIDKNYKLLTTLDIIMISDSYELKKICKNKYNFHITDFRPIHLGEINKKVNQDDIKGTLLEYFIMSKSSHIFCISKYYGSTFSKMCSAIYDIPITNINL